MATPLCPYFGSCGGCATQHLDYAVQLENKKKTLAAAIGFSDIKVFHDEPYFYRNRMDFVFHPKGIGLREKGNWRRIVPIDRCVISNERLNALMQEVIRFFGNEIDALDPVKRTGTFVYAIIRTPGDDSSVAFVLNKDSLHVEEALEKIRGFAEKTTSANVIVVYIAHNSGADMSDDYFIVKGSDELKTSYLGKTFHFSVQGFFQNNDRMAEKMHQYVHDLLKKYKTTEAHLLDLYGGVGTFGVINAPLFKSATIVESVESCIRAATKNIEINEIKNAKAVVLDAKHLKKLEFPSPLFVINDPPRSGMHEKTIEQLKKLRPEIIIYVSCNVQQLGKDLLKFRDYKLKSAAFFDLFPQTNHMESVAELVRPLLPLQ